MGLDTGIISALITAPIGFLGLIIAAIITYRSNERSRAQTSSEVERAIRRALPALMQGNGSDQERIVSTVSQSGQNDYYPEAEDRFLQVPVSGEVLHDTWSNRIMVKNGKSVVKLMRMCLVLAVLGYMTSTIFFISTVSWVFFAEAYLIWRYVLARRGVREWIEAPYARYTDVFSSVRPVSALHYLSIVLELEARVSDMTGVLHGVEDVNLCSTEAVGGGGPLRLRGQNIEDAIKRKAIFKAREGGHLRMARGEEYRKLTKERAGLYHVAGVCLHEEEDLIPVTSEDEHGLRGFIVGVGQASGTTGFKEEG